MSKACLNMSLQMLVVRALVLALLAGEGHVLLVGVLDGFMHVL